MSWAEPEDAVAGYRTDGGALRSLSPRSRAGASAREAALAAGRSAGADWRPWPPASGRRRAVRPPRAPPVVSGLGGARGEGGLPMPARRHHKDHGRPGVVSRKVIPFKYNPESQPTASRPRNPFRRRPRPSAPAGAHGRALRPGGEYCSRLSSTPPTIWRRQSHRHRHGRPPRASPPIQKLITPSKGLFGD